MKPSTCSSSPVRKVVAQQFLAAVQFRRPRRILLDGEVRDAGRELQAGRGADRRQRVVRHHPDVVRLGHRRDLLGAGDPAAPCTRPAADTAPRCASAASRTRRWCGTARRWRSGCRCAARPPPSRRSCSAAAGPRRRTAGMARCRAPSAIASGGVRRRWISMHRSTFGPTASRSRRTVSIASSICAACVLKNGSSSLSSSSGFRWPSAVKPASFSRTASSTSVSIVRPITWS